MNSTRVLSCNRKTRIPTNLSIERMGQSLMTLHSSLYSIVSM